MLKNLLIGALLGALSFSHLHAGVISPDLINSNLTSTNAATGSSDTYLLAQQLTGTASTYVDLSAMSGLLVNVTGSAGVVVNVQWNSQTYTAWVNGPTILAQAAQYLQKQARYVRFQVAPSSAAGYRATLWYTPVYGPSYSSAGETLISAAGFNFLSWTVKASGVTTNADSVISLTWAASTTSGPIFADLQCTGSTGINFLITASATTPAGFVANSGLSGYQPCGQISQVPLEVNAANTPHLHVVAVGLSNTSAAVGVVTKKRP